MTKVVSAYSSSCVLAASAAVLAKGGSETMESVLGSPRRCHWRRKSIKREKALVEVGIGSAGPTPRSMIGRTSLETVARERQRERERAVPLSLTPRLIASSAFPRRTDGAPSHFSRLNIQLNSQLRRHIYRQPNRSSQKAAAGSLHRYSSCLYATHNPPTTHGATITRRKEGRNRMGDQDNNKLRDIACRLSESRAGNSGLTIVITGASRYVRDGFE